MSDNLIVIDADTGVDDALAILMAISRQTRHLANVLAITTVQGNADVDQVCLNTLRVLQVADRLDIPVYGGVDRALTGSNAAISSYYHGKDGFGEVPDPNAPDLSHIQSEHAVVALIRLVNQYQGQITLVCIAPLTNIAVALRIDPAFGKKLRQCIIMGGNTLGKGNITSNAEFNFYQDPEAANVVLRELGCRITMITWELSIEYSLPWDVYDNIFDTQSKRSQFMQQINALAIRNYYSKRQSDNKDRQKFILCDEFAVALALDDRVATAAEEAICSVETNGSFTRGQMITHRQQLNTSSTTVSLVTALDLERCLQLVTAAVTD